jgi:hypothetical protein
MTVTGRSSHQGATPRHSGPNGHVW